MSSLSFDLLVERAKNKGYRAGLTTTNKAGRWDCQTRMFRVRHAG